MNKLSGSGQSNQSQVGNAQPHQITVNIVVILQQSNINMQMQIDPECPFNIFIQGVKEQIFSYRMQSQYKDNIEIQLGSGGQINQSESRSLQLLGFTNNCTLYVRLKLRGSSNSDQYLDHGNELYSQKRYKEAIQCFDEAIRQNSNNAEYYYGKGKCLSALNRKDEAINLYEQAFEKQRDCFKQLKSTMNMFGN